MVWTGSYLSMGYSLWNSLLPLLWCRDDASVILSQNSLPQGLSPLPLHCGFAGVETLATPDNETPTCRGVSRGWVPFYGDRWVFLKNGSYRLGNGEAQSAQTERCCAPPTPQQMSCVDGSCHCHPKRARSLVSEMCLLGGHCHHMRGCGLQVRCILGPRLP